MSPRLVLVNAALLAASGFFAFQLYAASSRPRPLPAPPTPPPARAADALGAATGTARVEPAPLNGAIAAKNLFSPSRSETPAAPGPASAPAAAKPLLHGVVLDEGKSRAYLEDPTSKRVFGYAVGDQVGGGRLEAIRADRVVIARPEGPIEVLLRDPSKPRPAPGPAQAGTAPAGAAARQVAPTPLPVPGVPGATVTPVPPRALQSLPPDFLRRRAPAAPTPPTAEPRG